MAAVIAVEAAEATEGAEATKGAKGGSKKGLKPDSEENAAAEGVESVKIVGQALSVASSVLSLMTALKKGKEDTADILERRLAAGLLRPDESRITMINDNLIASYWAPSNIHQLLESGTLPFGWSISAAVGQGFGADIAAFLLRTRRAGVAKQRDEERRRSLATRRIEIATQLNSQMVKTQQAVNQLNQSVV